MHLYFKVLFYILAINKLLGYSGQAIATVRAISKYRMVFPVFYIANTCVECHLPNTHDLSLLLYFVTGTCFANRNKNSFFTTCICIFTLDKKKKVPFLYVNLNYSVGRAMFRLMTAYLLAAYGNGRLFMISQ